MTRNLALIGLLCLGTGAVTYAPPVEARTYVDVDVNLAPPAPRYERVIVRPGYAWTPGYWRWDRYGHRHVWVGGVYVRERPGMVWVPHHWQQGPHGGWRFVEGHWARR